MRPAESARAGAGSCPSTAGLLLLGVIIALAAGSAPGQSPGGGTGSTAEVSDHDPERIQARLDEMREEIAAISRRLGRERERRQAEQAALAEAEKALSRIALDLRETRSRLDENRARLQRLRRRADALRAEIARHRAELGEQLRIAYRVGLRSRLRTLLDSDDPGRIARQLAMHGYLGRARMEAITSLDARLAELESVKIEQQRVGQRLEALAARQERTRNERSDALQQREQALAELERSIRDRSGRLAELRDSAAELEALLEELADTLADIPPDLEVAPFAELRGALPMPIDAPVRAGFADTRSGNVAWEGWLIEAEAGNPVRAVAYGRVAYADWLRGYGMMLIIDHGNGFMTLYGRNQSLIAEVGDWVEPGEIIALAGNSGGGRTPGLYFQIRRNGEPVDPAAWIDR